MLKHTDEKTGAKAVFVGPDDIRKFLKAAKTHFDKQGVKIDGVMGMPESDAMGAMASDAFNVDVFNSSFHEVGKKYGVIGKVMTENLSSRYLGEDHDSKENTKIGRFAIMTMFNAVPKDSELGKFLNERPDLFFAMEELDSETEVVLPWRVNKYARKIALLGGKVKIPEFSERAKTELTADLGNGKTIQKKFIGFQCNRELAKKIKEYSIANKLPYGNFYGEWRGGAVAAYTVADYLNGKVVRDVEDADWCIDTIVDTGNSSHYLHDLNRRNQHVRLASVAVKLAKTPAGLVPDVYLMDASGVWTVNSCHEILFNGYERNGNIKQSVKTRNTLVKVRP